MNQMICLILMIIAERAGDRPYTGAILVEKFETISIIELLRSKGNYSSSVEILELQRKIAENDFPNRQFDTWDESAYRYFRRELKLEKLQEN